MELHDYTDLKAELWVESLEAQRGRALARGHKAEELGLLRGVQGAHDLPESLHSAVPRAPAILVATVALQVFHIDGCRCTADEHLGAGGTAGTYCTQQIADSR